MASRARIDQTCPVRLERRVTCSIVAFCGILSGNGPAVLNLQRRKQREILVDHVSRGARVRRVRVEEPCQLFA